MGQSLHGRLREREESRNADDGTINRTKSCESEDFDGVVAVDNVSNQLEEVDNLNSRHGRVIQGPEQAEEDDVTVAGPDKW